MITDPSKFMSTSDFAAYANNADGVIEMELPATVTVQPSIDTILTQSITILDGGDSLRARISSDAYPSVFLPTLSFLVPTTQDGGATVYHNGSIVKSAGNQYIMKITYSSTGDGLQHTYTNRVRKITAKIRTFAPI